MIEPEAKKAQVEERKKLRKEKLVQKAKKRVPPVKKTKKLSKWEWIQESAKEHVVPSKAFQEKKAAQRKLIQAKHKKEMIREQREKKLKAAKVRAILAKRAALVTGAKPKKKKSQNEHSFQKAKDSFT